MFLFVNVILFLFYFYLNIPPPGNQNSVSDWIKIQTTRMSCSYLLNKLKFWCSRVTSHKFLCKSKTNLTLLMLNIFPTCFGFQKNWKLYLVQSKRSFCGVECLIWFDSGGKKIFDLKIFFPITMYIFLIIILFKKIGKTKNFVSKISVIFLDKIFKILYASLKS